MDADRIQLLPYGLDCAASVWRVLQTTPCKSGWSAQASRLSRDRERHLSNQSQRPPVAKSAHRRIYLNRRAKDRPGRYRDTAIVLLLRLYRFDLMHLADRPIQVAYGRVELVNGAV